MTKEAHSPVLSPEATRLLAIAAPLQPDGPIARSEVISLEDQREAAAKELRNYVAKLESDTAILRDYRRGIHPVPANLIARAIADGQDSKAAKGS